MRSFPEGGGLSNDKREYNEYYGKFFNRTRQYLSQ